VVIAICLASMGLLHQLWSLAAVLIFMSGSAAFLNVQLVSWFQQRVERAMLGRVMSVLMFASIGLIPFSIAAAGLLIQWSLPGMFAVSGALVMLVTAAAAVHRPVRDIE